MGAKDKEVKVMARDYWAEHLKLVEKSGESDRFNEFFSKESSSICKNMCGFRIHGKKVLDLGCGYGRDAAYYVKKKNKVTGVDLSKIAIRNCKNSFKKQKLRARFIIANAKRLPFKANSFDVVHSASLLHFFNKRDIRSVLREAKRVLAPGGLFFSNLPSTKDFRNRHEAGKRFLKSTRYFYKSAAEVRRLFERAGFVIVKLKVFTSKHIFYAKRYPKSAKVHGWIIIAKKPFFFG